MDPLVSILIPAHNAGRWIEDTLESAVGQTWWRKEIIVVDDGSVDDTLTRARAFEGPSVKVISQENRGACHARNKALQESSGDYIQWLDADDLLAPDKIERQLAACLDRDRNSTVTLSAAWGKFLRRTNAARFEPSHLWRDLERSEWLLLRLERPGMMTPHSWLVSRKVSEEAGPWNEALRRNQDGEYFFRIVAASSRIQFVPDAKCYYRRSGSGSISNDASVEAMESVFESLQLSISLLMSTDHSERARRAVLSNLRRFYAQLISEEHTLYETLIGKVQDRILELGGDLPSGFYSNKQAIAAAVLGRQNALLLKRWLHKLNYFAAHGRERLLP